MGYEPPIGQERRAQPRQRTLLRGRICYGPRHVISVDCGIRNLSDQGAQVKIPAGQPLPSVFTLLHVVAGLAFDAHLTWRKADLIGVQFEGQHNLKTEISDDFAPLRAIWMALASS